MRLIIVNSGKSCPPQKRAASTKPTACSGYGFVAASSSHALREGEGTFHINVSHYRPPGPVDMTCAPCVPCRHVIQTC